MVYPSGEVETTDSRAMRSMGQRSGWFIHPGKLKPGGGSAQFYACGRFRMVYPSGEVETTLADARRLSLQVRFRMVYPSGEVETMATPSPPGG